MAVDEDTLPAPAGEDMHGLFKAVKELKDAVGDMKEGAIDESTVRQHVEAAMALSRRTGQREGFLPDDTDEGPRSRRLQGMSMIERQAWVMQQPAPRAAMALRRPVEVVQHYQRTSDRLVLLSQITKKAPDDLEFFWDEFVPAQQAAMDTKTVGEGKELLPPVGISSDIIERIEGALTVLASIPQVGMPTNPFRFPTKGPRRHVAVLAEALETGTPKAKQLIPGVPGFIELAATKFAGEIVTSKELEEDAAIALLPFLESELFEWLAWDLEDACINGDTLNTMDAGIPADSPRTGWDGLRKQTLALAKEPVGGVLTAAAIHKTRARMGRYGLNPQDLTLLVTVKDLYNLIGSDDVKTIDAYGQNATLLTGELGRMWGIPIVASDLVPTTTDATGVVPASPGTKSIAILFHRKAFMRGVRRTASTQVLTELYAESDQDAVLLTTRQAFGARWPTDPAVAQAINIT